MFKSHLFLRQLTWMIGSLLIFLGIRDKGWASFKGVSVNRQNMWGRLEISSFGSRPTPSVDASGRYVVFASAADDLVVGDTNMSADVFVRDQLLGTTQRVSVHTDGSEADSGSIPGFQSISADGRYVVFVSSATNLVLPDLDQNKHSDVFLHDRVTGETKIMSRKGNSESNGQSIAPSISQDGEFIVFESDSTNLVSDDTHGTGHLFLKNREKDDIFLADVDLNGGLSLEGAYDPVINRDGTKVVFVSTSSNLVSGDKNGKADVFVRDFAQGKTFRLSVSDKGEELDGQSLSPSIEQNGCRVAFISEANNVISGRVLPPGQLYVRDVCKNTTVWISQDAHGQQAEQVRTAVISGNGRCVVFEAIGPNLSLFGKVLPTLSNIYSRNLQDGTIQLITGSEQGTPSDNYSYIPFPSADCSSVVFASQATNLIPRAQNDKQYFEYFRPKPVASFTVNPTSDPFTFHFDSTASQALDQIISAYRWDFGDGTFSVESNPNHTYTKPGILIAKLTITDNIDAQASTQQELILRSNQLGGGGFNFGCSNQDGSPLGLVSIWLYLLVLSGFFLLTARKSLLQRNGGKAA